MTNFTPLFAAMFSIILLNESVHTYHIISAILITAGILICSYKNIKRRYSMFRTDITERFEQLKAAKTVKLLLLLSNLSSKIFTGSSYEVVDELCEKFKRSRVELALYCIAIAACYAVTPVSDFNVGRLRLAKTEISILGQTKSFPGNVCNNRSRRAKCNLARIFSRGNFDNRCGCELYPCGHCRQFMNELNSAASLKVHLPHSQNNLLHSYLPDSFGPKDLGIEKVLFDEQPQQFEVKGDHLQQAAIFAANNAYAPYSNAFSGVALQVGERIVCGKYTENAALILLFTVAKRVELSIIFRACRYSRYSSCAG